MDRRSVLTRSLATAGVLLAQGHHAHANPGTPPHTGAPRQDIDLLKGQETEGMDPTELHAYSLGLQAYQYGWPLIYFATLRTRWTLDPQGVRRPLNSWIQTREFVATSHYRNGGSFNTDTVYTSAFIDLRQGPVVLSLTDPGPRYFSVQISDLYTNNLAYISQRAGGPLWGDFVLVPPGWQGTLPEGRFQRVLQVPQHWLFVLVRMRIDQDDPAEVAQAKALYARNRITPLGDFLAGREFVASDHQVFDVNRLAQNPLRAFATLNHMLTENPPDADDAALLQAFRTIGVGPGLDLSANPATVNRGLARAARDGLRTLRAHVERPWARAVNGWYYFPTHIGQAKTNDYLMRSAWQSLWGIVAHPPHECTYLWASVDQHGERLNSRRRYELVMRPTDVPRVEAFWSFTLYQDFNLVPNEINRWAIRENTRGLQREADGTLRIAIQAQRPADALVSNWLPAPKEGNFNLTMRNYMPSAEIVAQRYDPPALRRVG
ncbi:DUF1254 domain-containing protein [Curvibacter cyanobacteriorum]|nr:DUF1214 domain-containing protein [Curvibacter sp. HBC61]